MKKRIWIVLSVVLLLAAAWFIHAFTGNPVSALMVRRNAGAHIQTVYSDPDLKVEDVRYSFKDRRYHAFIVSDTSWDTHFTLYYNGLGQLISDTYEDHVASGWNTIRRLDAAYQQQADPAIKALPYDVSIGFCQLNYLFPEEPDSEVPALRMQELIPDQEYDISQLGAQYGQLILYLTVEDISPEAAAQILLTLDRQLAEVPFHSLNLTLQEAGSGEELYLRNFPRAEIASEDLVDRLLRDYPQAEMYAQMDRELPVGVTLQAVFREDGSAELICGEETLTFANGTFPEESTALGETQIEVLSPGAVRAVFGATSILFLEEGAQVPDITADVVWGHVTQRFGANFAVFPEDPPEQLRQALEEQGMTVLTPSLESTVNIQSDGKEVLLFWTSHASFPAMSAAK